MSTIMTLEEVVVELDVLGQARVNYGIRKQGMYSIVFDGPVHGTVRLGRDGNDILFSSLNKAAELLLSIRVVSFNVWYGGADEYRNV